MQFVVLLLLCLFTQGNALENDFTTLEPTRCVSATDGLPSSLIAGHVCAVNGVFVDSILDAAIEGPEKLALERFYCGDHVAANLSQGWALNHLNKIHFERISNTRLYATITQPTGTSLLYKFDSNSQEQSNEFFMNLSIPEGFTNTGRGELSGRTNIKNDKVQISLTHNVGYVTDGDGTQHYFGHPQKEKQNKWHEIQRRSPSGYVTNYITSETGHTSKINIENPSHRECSSMTIGAVPYYDWKDATQISTSNGQTINYYFKYYSYTLKDANGKKHHTDLKYLSRVERTTGPTEEYEYVEKTGDLKTYHHVSLKKLPDDRFLSVEYFANKVSALKAPVGPDQTPITTHQFRYLTPNLTAVTDAYNRSDHYAYDNQKRITCIGHFDKHNTLYSTEHYFWGADNTADHGNLTHKIVKIGNERYYKIQSYEYDNRGNIVVERLSGKLTGKYDTDLGDTEEKRFTYSNDGLNLLMSSKEANGREIHYGYMPGTNLMTSLLVCDHGAIVKRTYHVYDDNNICVATIVDNATDVLPQYASNITERHITRYFPREQAPAMGLPGEIQELFLDFNTMQEVLIKRLVNTYAADGKLTKQDVYGSDKQYAYSLEWKYDSHGNLKEETNARGEKTYYDYDKNDNRIKKQTPTHTFTYTYDYSNRLVTEERHDWEGTKLVTRHRYDKLSNRTATIDPLGRETQYEYDEFSRLSKVIHPQVFNEKLEVISPTETFDYDIGGHVISQTTLKGGTIATTRNIRGQPLSIQYPDGTSERFEYTLDGLLELKVAKNGITTRYTHDIFGRVTSEESFSLTGDSLTKTSSVYNAFHLMYTIDAAGTVTYYTYDFAGRLAAETTNDKKTTYEYDTLGRLFKTYSWLSDTEARVTVTEYDNTDRIIEQRVEDLEGNVLQLTRKDYDCDDNILRLQEGDAVTLTKYDGQCRPKTITDPLGNVTQITYKNFHVPFGYYVREQTETDPLGNQTITTFDGLDRAYSTVKKDPFGILTAKQMILFDTANNECLVSDFVIIDGQIERIVTAKQEYNLNNDLIAQTEAIGTTEQKITRRAYNKAGELWTITKPDGVILIHTYDALGRLSTVISSDGTIDFSYTYDNHDLVLTATDNTAQMTTYREYDANGRMKKETLAHGIALAYDYDTLERVIKVAVGDREILYTYDPLDLKSVDCREGSHKILSRNLAGQPTQIRKMCGSEAAYAYDLAGQCEMITHPTFTQTGKYDALGNLISTVLNQEDRSYSYDPLSQLTQENTHTYAYDSIGNRRKRDSDAYQYNSLNQIVDNSYAYDANGNMKAGQGNIYSYDALDRLIQVVTPTSTLSYVYDTFGRRLIQNVDGQENQYLYQGEEDIGISQDGTIKQLRMLGEGTQSVAIELEGTLYVPQYDLSGNIALLLDLQDNVAEQYTYSAFAEESPRASQNPWRYAGKRTDPETGFVYFGKRYYSPDLGRWITPDPLGFADGPNLYTYVHNNPLRYFDAHGLFSLPSFSFKPILTGTTFSSGPSNLTYFDSYEKMQPWYAGSECYSLNKPDNPNFRICFTNGMWNNKQESMNHMNYISKLSGNQNIHGVYNATHGIMDPVEVLLGYNYVATTPVRKHHEQWDSFFDNCSDSATLLQVCTSQGALHVRNALLGCSEERRQRIHVVAIAPAAYISSETCGSVVHYRAPFWKDPIPYLDLVGAWRERNTTITLNSNRKAPLHDHTIQSPTYRGPLKYEIDNYIQKAR